MTKNSNTKTINPETIARIEERRARFHADEERSLKATQNIIASMNKSKLRKEMQEEKRRALKAGLAFYHQHRYEIIYIENYVGGKHIAFAFLKSDDSCNEKDGTFYNVSYAIKSTQDEFSDRILRTVLGTRLLEKNCLNLFVVENTIPEQNKETYLFHLIFSRLVQETINHSLRDQALRGLIKNYIKKF